MTSPNAHNPSLEGGSTTAGVGASASESRALDLLADRALGGLSERDEAELASLLAEHPYLDVSEIDGVAALAEVAMSPRSPGAMPLTLRDRLMADAKATLTGQPTDAGIEPTVAGGGPTITPWLTIGGWLAAAVAATIAIVAMMPAEPTPEPTLVDRRDELRFTDGTRKIDLRPPPNAQGVQAEVARWDNGDVVWNQERQAGFLRFEGLAPNDPQKAQYQLWIVDGSQQFPIDGGVFDVPADRREVIVPIRPSIRVDDPRRFVITVEEPGGVVVSDQDRVPLLSDPMPPPPKAGTCPAPRQPMARL